jgi:wobble nucleotide-excising tRNase
MITRILGISGVGRFENYASKGDMAFRKSTIVYAENGHGKTTLSNIIKSLSSGNNSLITNRKTIGLDEQTIRIEVGGVIHAFKDGQWKGGGVGNRIEVFDAFFVNENIYSGFEFSFEHSKNLHKFALGEEGVRIAKAIEAEKSEIELHKKDLRVQEASIQTQLGREPFVSFLSLKEDSHIDTKVAEATKNLAIANASKEIREKPFLSSLQKINLERAFEKIKTSLESCLESISGSYITGFQEHKTSLEQSGVTGAEDWLYEGFKAIKSSKDNCLFCKQPISDSMEIIKSYNNYFNEEYKKTQANVLAQDTWLKGQNYYAIIRDNEEASATNDSLAEYWSNHCEVEKPSTVVEFRAEEISDEIQKVGQKVAQKLSNILEKQDSSGLDSLLNLIKKVNERIEEYNTQVQVINNKIGEIKRSDISVTTASGQLAYLILVQKRHGELKSACDDYKAIKDILDESNSRKKALQDELKLYSKKFMDSYGSSINQYLNKFFPKGYYQLSSIDSKFSGTSKEPSAEFTLTIKGHPINFVNKEGSTQGKYTLSEGDKSSIAFAFFLAKLELDDISEKIIVFDDPVTSLDRNRRRRTIDEIISVTQRAKQVIMLSHSTTFVYDVYERSSNPKVLKIAYEGVLEDYSSIVDDMQNTYVKQIKALECFIVNPLESEISNIKGSIRLVLEDNIKFRFLNYLSNPQISASGKTVGPITKGDGLGKMVDILEASSCSFRGEKTTIIAKLRLYNQLSSSEHHGSFDKTHRIEQLSLDELIGYVEEVLSFIDKEI